MKLHCSSVLVLATVAILVGSGSRVSAQDLPPAQNTVQLSYGVPDVLKLAQARLSDEVIVSYIHKSRLSYADLGASEIVYLNQQGVSSRVITTMLAQQTRLSEAASRAPAQQTTIAPVAAIASGQTAAIAPVQTAAYLAPIVAQAQPSPTVIVMRDSSPRLVDYGIYPRSFYYPGYSYYGYSYPRASFSFGGGVGYCGVGYRGSHRFTARSY